MFISLFTLIFVQFPTAAATCSQTQGDANIETSPSSASEGTYAYETIPFTPSLCGSGWSNGGYVHGSVGQYLSVTCYIYGLYPLTTYIEAGIYYGTSQSGASSGSNIHYFYNYVTGDILGVCNSPSFNDVSAGGTYPSVGDNVSIDLNAQPGTSSNYWTVEYDDFNTGVYVTVSNIALGSRNGPLNIAEMETWNPNNVVVVYWGTLEYIYGGSSYNIGHFPTNPSTSLPPANYYLTQPNTYYDDWCAYYTGYSSYC
jgi:hypothetical protein